MDSLTGLWERHPYLIAGGVFIVGAIVIWYYSGSGGGSAGGDTTGYYAAQSSAIQSGNNLAALYSTNATRQFVADAGVRAIHEQISGDVAVAQSNNAAAENLAVTAGTVSMHQSDNTLANQLATAHSVDLRTTSDAANTTAALADQFALGSAAAGTAQFIAQSNFALGSAAAGTAQYKATADFALRQDQIDSAREVAGAQIGSAERISAAANSIAFWRPGTVTALTFGPGGVLTGQSVATPGSVANPLQTGAGGYTGL